MKVANRKQRRNNKKNYNDEYTQSTKTILITTGVVLAVFGMFYLMTILLNNSKRGLNTKEPTKEEAAIQYFEILGDDTFEIDKDEYYVLFYDFNGPKSVYLDYLFDQYSKAQNQYIYKVDLSNGFNKKFISEETNEYAGNASELKVKDATLIKIRYGENVSYVEGSSQIIAEELNK